MRTLRIDTCVLSSDKVAEVLKKYADKGKVTYCVAKEFGSQTEKPHHQGWFIPTDKKADEAILKQFNRLLQGTPANTKSFEPSHHPVNEMAYILNNSEKPKPLYTDCFTSYTEHEFLELQERKQFVEMRPHKLNKTNKSKSKQDKVFEYLESNCVKDGKILYHLIPKYYLEYAPIRLNKHILLDNCRGYTVKLENKYTDNKRCRKSLYNEMIQLDTEHVFATPKDFSYLNTEDI